MLHILATGVTFSETLEDASGVPVLVCHVYLSMWHDMPDMHVHLFSIDFKKERGSKFDCIFLTFLLFIPQSFQLGEPMLMIIFYLKTSAFRVVTLQFSTVLIVAFMRKHMSFFIKYVHHK